MSDSDSDSLSSPSSPDSPSSPNSPSLDTEHSPTPPKVPSNSSNPSLNKSSVNVRLNRAQKLIDSVVEDMANGCEGMPFELTEKVIVKINALRRASKACAVKEEKAKAVKAVKTVKTVKVTKKK